MYVFGGGLFGGLNGGLNAACNAAEIEKNEKSKKCIFSSAAHIVGRIDSSIPRVDG